MKKFALIFLALFSLAAPVQAAPVNFSLDKEHTNILFYVNHLGFSEVVGAFRDFDGKFVFDEEKPEHSKVEMMLRPAGIETSSKELDKHLQGKDWFNSEKFPELTFKSSEVKLTGKNTADVTGWLSLLGQDKAATLHVTFNGSGEHPMTKKQVAGFTGETTLKRSAWGMKNGIPMVGDEVRLYFSLEGNAK